MFVFKMYEILFSKFETYLFFIVVNIFSFFSFYYYFKNSALFTGYTVEEENRESYFSYFAFYFSSTVNGRF